MASWCYTEIGISVTDDDLELKQQYLDCLGLLKIDGDVFNETECDAAGYELYDSLLNTVCFQVTMIFGKHSDDYSIPENLHDIFSLVNLLFPHTYLYCQHYSGTSVTTENECEEYLFDPKKKKLTKRASGDGFIDIAHEGDSIGKENVPEYCTVKYQVTDEDIYYSPQEFAERCRKKKQGNLENDFDDDYVSFSELQVTCDVSLREEIISFFIEDFTKRWNEALQRIQEKTEDHSIPDGTGLPFDISFTDYGFLIVMNSLFNTVL